MPSSASTPTDRTPREQAGPETATWNSHEPVGSEAASGNDREPAHRAAAARVVAEVADRLADPERVARIAGVPDNLMHYPGDPQPVWDPLQLSDGHPGVALLFAELAVTDPALRHRAHAHLSAGLAAGIRPVPQSLFGGMVALAYAGHTTAVGSGGYTAMLAGLDRHILDRVRTRARADLERTRAGDPAGAWSRYDVLAGTAGIGRYLLARHLAADGQEARQAAGAALTEVLTSLVAAATADDITRHGSRLPAWWVTDGLDHGLPEHVNLGLAHGVPGPLALLALAWRTGVRVDRQDEAVERIMALLTRLRTRDEAGPRWPHLMSRERIEKGSRRSADGTPGATERPVRPAPSTSPEPPWTGRTGAPKRRRRCAGRWRWRATRRSVTPRCATAGPASCRSCCAPPRTPTTRNSTPPPTAWRPACSTDTTPGRRSASATPTRSRGAHWTAPASWRGRRASPWPCTRTPPAVRRSPPGTAP